MSIFLIVVLVLIVLLLGWGVGAYNGLIALRNRVKNAFAQIDVQLQRRYDLIPNLVETAKGYMKHERETLTQVIEARNQAQASAQRAHDNPADAGAIRELAGAEAILGGALTRFFALAEAYPDLKANQNMMQIQEELSTTENRVAFARQAYNDAVMNYNNRRESFPALVIANNFGFGAAQLWELDQKEARQPPKISFS
jgi:LemA protein